MDILCCFRRDEDDGDDAAQTANPLGAEEPIVKCLSCKYGTGDNVKLALCEADFTNEWASSVLGTEVVSFRTHLCGMGQVGVTVLILDIEYAKADASMPKSIAVKMHGQGEEQRKNCGTMGLYHKEIFAYHDFNIAESVPVVSPGVLGIWYDTRECRSFRDPSLETQRALLHCSLQFACGLPNANILWIQVNRMRSWCTLT